MAALLWPPKETNAAGLVLLGSLPPISFILSRNCSPRTLIHCCFVLRQPIRRRVEPQLCCHKWFRDHMIYLLQALESLVYGLLLAWSKGCDEEFVLPKSSGPLFALTLSLHLSDYHQLTRCHQKVSQHIWISVLCLHWILSRFCTDCTPDSVDLLYLLLVTWHRKNEGTR